MTFSRRGFFKLAAGAAAMSAVPSVAITKAVPTIYCNGVDCDSAGLDALLSGDVVEFSNPELASRIGWCGDMLELDGAFVIKSPVSVRTNMSNKSIRGGRFDLHSSGFIIKGAEGVMFLGMDFVGTNLGPHDVPIDLSTKSNERYMLGSP